MNLFGRLFGFRPAPPSVTLTRDVDILQSYGLPGYAPSSESDHERRVWDYHGVRLASGGVPAWIEQISPYLTCQGCRIESVANVGASDGYRICLNNRRCLIYLNTELVHWAAAVISTVQIVNELLEAAGSDERGYILREADSDGQVIFMSSATCQRLLGDRSFVPGDPPLCPGTYARPSREATVIFPATVERAVAR
jgi:hypothetical protein